jgi:hypothetical protein
MHCSREHYSPEPGAVIQRPKNRTILDRCEVRTALIVLMLLVVLKKLKVL